MFGPCFEKQEVTSPIKPKTGTKVCEALSDQNASPDIKKKGPGKGKWKKIAREIGKAQDMEVSIQAHEVGNKRAEKIKDLLLTEGKASKRVFEEKSDGGDLSA